MTTTATRPSSRMRAWTRAMRSRRTLMEPPRRPPAHTPPGLGWVACCDGHDCAPGRSCRRGPRADDPNVERNLVATIGRHRKLRLDPCKAWGPQARYGDETWEVPVLPRVAGLTIDDGVIARGTSEPSPGDVPCPAH